METKDASLWPGLLLRASVALLGALALYALGAGPASYYETRYMRTDGKQGSVLVCKKLRILYRPLHASVQGTPLQTPLVHYRDWWGRRAKEKHPRAFCVSNTFWVTHDFPQ
jgi:hypothetical protein